MDEFARNTYVQDGIQLTSDQRLALSLTSPEHPAAMSPTKVEKITKNQIRNALADLVHGKMDKVSGWLDRIAEDSPAAAVDRLIELLKFTTPQVKAVAVDVRSGDGSVKTYSSQELQQMISGE